MATTSSGWLVEVDYITETAPALGRGSVYEVPAMSRFTFKITRHGEPVMEIPNVQGMVLHGDGLKALGDHLNNADEAFALLREIRAIGWTGHHLRHGVMDRAVALLERIDG